MDEKALKMESSLKVKLCLQHLDLLTLGRVCSLFPKYLQKADYVYTVPLFSWLIFGRNNLILNISKNSNTSHWMCLCFMDINAYSFSMPTESTKSNVWS